MPRGLLFEPKYRNRTEKAVGTQLENAGVPFAYESIKLPYTVPERVAKYLPDFPITDSPIILEVKGWFGRNGAKERQKMVLLKEQYPHLDFRLVFTDANKKLYKGSKTTYAAWADENGLKWCDKATIPASWLREMKRSAKRKK
jgi:hypothetical protein